MQVLRQVQSNSECALAVTAVGNSIGVAAGTVKLNGANYYLLNDHLHTVEEQAYQRTILGFLFAVGGELKIKVHELSAGQPFVKDQAGLYLYTLYRAFIPAGPVDLETARIEVSQTSSE